MKVISPITLTSGMITSSNAVETYSNYAAGTTYALGAKVIYGNFTYESLVSSNVGNQPDISPTKWLEIGPSNKWAMFDNRVDTQTTRATPLDVVITPSAVINSLALLNMDATSVIIDITDGANGPSIYSNTINLDDTSILDWYMYFFEPYDFRRDVVLTNIPPYSTAVINISIVNTGSTSAIGNVVLGNIAELGGTQYGVGVGIRDYSIKETDDFGNTTFLVRAFSKRMQAQVFLNNSSLNYVVRTLTSLRAVPAVWIGSESPELEPLIVYGFYRDFNIDISYPTNSLCSIEIEGLT
jgi:hypothetical protein